MTNGWPDAERPGVPINPERIGPHQLRDASGLTHLLLWQAPWWIAGWGHIARKPEEAANAFSYVGPCLTPAEAATLAEAARREEREACAAVADVVFTAAYHREKRFCGFTHSEAGAEQAAEEIAAAIRARGAA